MARLKTAVQTARPGVCAERALIWTRYFRNRANRKKHPHVQAAEALGSVLMEKRITIYPDELIVGNYSSRRVGGSIYPELHGLPVLLDLFELPKRALNPLEVAVKDRYRLLGIVPFWLTRFVGIRAYDSMLEKGRFLIDELRAHYYLINESGGISHFAPDYEALITLGTDGIKARALALQGGVPLYSDKWYFYQGVVIAAEALAGFGARYAALAADLARCEADPGRKSELEHLAGICLRVPRKPAAGFHEAVQSLFFAQIAINLESLDNAVSPGRMDQYLYPLYQQDVAAGRLTRERAREILGAFAIKTSEIVPVFSEHLTRFHGGMFNGQVVTIGGTDHQGRDGVNELSMIFLEIMDRYAMRQPNWHARVHSGTDRTYMETLAGMLARGVNSPALYNDDAIVPMLQHNGYSLADARDYTAVGCVEPVSQGRSFSSTDAALFNLPVMLELALNRGRRFNSRFRSGVLTCPVENMRSMGDVKAAFEAQLQDRMNRLIKDLKAVETANRRFHPTPLTSMLIQGCLERGICSTAGGARYNFSGIQCVGPADTGDALFAIDRMVFRERSMTLADMVTLLKSNGNDPAMVSRLRHLDKFGNDIPEVDGWTRYCVEKFSQGLSRHLSTRKGRYVTGLYSVTAHDWFGRVTGMLPNGRLRGEPFASGISPSSGMDISGPTAMLNSVASLDFKSIANGINLNIRFDGHTLRGRSGVAALGALIRTYFRKGGLQAQINVLDPGVLEAARNNPDLYPNLLVRVSGYSAYFNDLSPGMKDEIIRRTRICLQQVG
ncbi:MAG: pyruvate formate lyase family protein [Pseudomonadota bacterium]